MAMTVKTNMSAVSTLNKLNQNSSDLTKSLKKVSSGMKVNGAGDDASAYSISERMRVRIRSLGQCENNTENGKSMLKTAERAVNEQVDITKRLKENALKSANDTCTDEDRAIIQKETNRLLMQMNDISYETNYNGIQLLNGRTITEEYKPIFRERTVGNTANVVQITEYGTTAANSPRQTLTGKLVSTGGESELKLDYQPLPQSLHGQGFSSLCKGCQQFASVLFDANTTESVYASDGKGNGYRAEVFVIGIAGCKSADDVANAITRGLSEVRAAQASAGKPIGGPVDGIATIHNITFGQSSTDPSKYVIKVGAGSPNQVIYNGVSGDVEYTGGVLPYQSLMIQGATTSSQETRIELPNTTLDALFPGAPAVCDLKIAPTDADYPKEFPSDFVVPGSTEYEYYNQKYKCNDDIVQINRAKWYDEVWPYARKGASASGSCVTTIEKATKFMDDVDQAMKYLLHCATNLGAQCQRMDVMNANLVTSDESTQASESLIRDADMAKEMVSYEKHNILTQTAQSALAQANQTSSGVLNILQ